MATEHAKKMDTAVRAIAPVLRERGFRKQRHAFNREGEEGLVQVVTFQMGAHQPPRTREIAGLRENLYGFFTINLGLHLDEVREVDERRPKPRPSFLREEDVPPPRPRPTFFREGDCHVVVRLGSLLPVSADTWWSLGLNEDELVALLRRLLADHALPFLDRFRSRDALLDAWHGGDPAVRYTPRFTIGRHPRAAR
jgi:hypothetical protein